MSIGMISWTGTNHHVDIQTINTQISAHDRKASPL